MRPVAHSIDISKYRVFHSQALCFSFRHTHTCRKQLTETWQFNLFDASQYSYATLHEASFAAMASYSQHLCVYVCVFAFVLQACLALAPN